MTPDDRRWRGTANRRVGLVVVGTEPLEVPRRAEACDVLRGACDVLPSHERQKAAPLSGVQLGPIAMADHAITAVHAITKRGRIARRIETTSRVVLRLHTAPAEENDL